MNWLRRFIAAVRPLRTVDGYGLTPDPDAAARLKTLQAAMRESMGARWIGHPRHATRVSAAQLARDWDEAITENAVREAHSNVRKFKR